ncbi:MAG: serine protease [Proteobacteria bacterium]|nr:serine protease [Pseudomonadota bacterium]MCP4919293.1 serine protease [Pseudomonadota bacterium]
MIWLSIALAQDAPPIVGGTEAPVGKWPATVALLYNGYTNCTATLIAPDLLLTAGHCVDEDVTEVHFGVDHADPDQVVAVAELLPHPDHDDGLDIGLIWLAEPVDVSTPQLMLGCAVGYLVDGTDAQIVGYGNTETDGGGPNSKQLETPVTVTDANCDTPGAGCRDAAGVDSELIAGGDGHDSCSGDSGGPLYLWGQDGVPYLAGITSRADYNGIRTCGDGGIYVRVDAVAAWVEESTGDMLELPDCGGWENGAPVPEPFYLALLQGEVERVELAATDPDTGQPLTFSLLDGGTLGDAQVSDGVLTYAAVDDGQETLTLAVHDGHIEVPFEVGVTIEAHEDVQLIESEPNWGCSSGPRRWPALFWLALAALSPRWLRSRRPAG